MTEREALKLALKALQSDDYWTHVEAVNAIHKALEQQNVRDEIDRGAKTLRETYLAHPEPPLECQTEAEKTAFAFGWFKAMEAQRTWVGLTDEEILRELERVDPHTKRLPTGLKIFAHYLEAKLKEKNT